MKKYRILLLPMFGLFVMLCIVFEKLIYVPFAIIVTLIVMFSIPAPDKPVIRYGEFPFRLVYEIDGERHVIEDTIICQYDGFALDGSGKYRKWKTRLASGEGTNDYITLLNNEVGHAVMSAGRARVYMGCMIHEMDNWERRELRKELREAGISDVNSEISVFEVDEYGRRRRLREEELLEKYNIKIIEWTHSPPIKNTFKKPWLYFF